MDQRSFKTGFDVALVVNNPELDFSTEESQLKILDFYDKVQRSYLGKEDWCQPFSMNSWFYDFIMWTKAGQCSHLTQGLLGFERVVPQEQFYPCLEEALEKVGEERRKDLIWEELDELWEPKTASLHAFMVKDLPERQNKRKLVGFKSKVHVK